MRYVQLGSTDLTVSVLCLGTAAFSGDLGRVGDRESERVIRRALDMGVNFFDTAEAYGFGRAEQVLARALAPELRGNRERVILATKGGQVRRRGRLCRDSSEASLRRGLEASLSSLGTDYVDLYYIHWPDPSRPMEEVAAMLDTFVAQGKARVVGLSNASIEDIEAFRVVRRLDVVQPPYSMLRREAEADVLPACRESGIGVACYGVLGHGLLGGTRPAVYSEDDWRSAHPAFQEPRYSRNLSAVAELARIAASLGCSLPQLAVAWALAHEAVHAVILGARHPRQLEESGRAVEVTLSEEVRGRIASVLATVTSIGGPSPEARNAQPGSAWRARVVE
jgi:aryl-alcohol dehydrogenase-like predicted oxidoreductase